MFKKIFAHKIFSKKLNGLTLQDYLVGLVIGGILAAIFYPKLLPLITKAKTSEAEMQLSHLYSLQEMYYYKNDKYSNNLEELGFVQGKLTTDGGNANYIIEVSEASENSFIAKATAVKDFDKDGTINVWEVNEEKKITEVTPD